MRNPNEGNQPLSLEKYSGNKFRSAMLIALLSVVGCDEAPVQNQEPLQNPKPQGTEMPNQVAKPKIAVVSNPPPICKDYRAPKDSAELPGSKEIEEAEVVCVIDGDTFDARLKRNNKIVRVRPWGMDCPEVQTGSEVEKEKGRQATRETQNLLANRQVILEPPFVENGKRILMHVRLKNGIDFSRRRIEDCICHYYHDSRNDRRTEYKKAQKKACRK
jgi:endonuclease YncB( thermonuclease family)